MFKDGKFTYYAKRVTQWNEALPFYVIDVGPGELLQWSSVPNKSPQVMHNYQRFLDERWKKITNFMESDKGNIIPGTIIVASQKAAGSDGDQFFEIEEVEIEGVEAKEHNLVKISFKFDLPDPTNNDELLESLKGLIAEYEHRLNADEMKATELIPSKDIDATPDVLEVGKPVPGVPNTVVLEIAEFQKFVWEAAPGFVRNHFADGDEVSVVPADHFEYTSSLAEFVKGLRETERDWEDVCKDKEQLMKWKEWILEECMIARIMDGQHRVWGARGVNPDSCEHLEDEEEPKLSVTLIPDMAVAEQIFHFAMMNMTPVKVPQAQARNNATASLSRDEFESYQPRLSIHIDTADAEWEDAVKRHENSPWIGKITLTFLGDDKEVRFVKDTILFAVGKHWRTLGKKTPGLGNLFSKANSTLWTSDKDQFRLLSFLKFWEIVSQKWPTQWKNRDSMLWRKVSLMSLPRFVLDQMGNMVDFWTNPKMLDNVAPMNGLEAFSEMVESIIEQMADDLFDWPWHHVEDSASSYPILVDAFRRQHNRGTPGKRLIDKRDRHWMGASE